MRETWGLLIGRIFSDPVWWFYVFWLPKYLTDARGFSLQLIGLIAWMPYLFSDTGALVGGWISGRLVARGWAVVRARKAVMFGSMLAMPFGAIIAFTPSATLAVAMICLVLFAHMSWKTNLATLNVDLYPKEILASAAGLVATGSSIGGAVFTMISGYLIHGRSYAPVFLIMAVLHPIAYFIVNGTIGGRGADRSSTIKGTTVVVGRHQDT
jgi:ACS family hexuronate transporter-like MFS transporter